MSGDPLNQRALAIIQARTSSSRLPKKVVRPLAGCRMLELMLERVRDGLSIRTVVATSTEKSDDIVAELCDEMEVDVVRGPLDDVLGRFTKVIDKYEPEVVIRLTGDNPFTDARAVETGLEQFAEWENRAKPDAAGISNHLSDRQDPHGYAVEVVRAERLRWLHEQNLDQAEREHVTLGFINRDIYDSYQILEGDNSNIRWTVDYPEDLAYMDKMFSVLGHDVDAEAALEWSRRNPHPRLTRDAN